MSESIGDAFVEIGAKTGGFFTAMSEIEKRFAGTATGLQGQATALALKLGIIAGGGMALGKGISAAAEWEQENQNLAIAVRVAGGAVDEMIPKLDAYADAMEKATTYDDSAIKSAMAMGLQIGIGTDRIEEATRAAVGLSAKYGIDLSTAMQQISRLAAGGTARFLSMYGVIDKTKSSSEQFNEAIQKGNDAFGIAEARASTMIGRWTQLKTATGDASEGLGTMVVDLLRVKDILEGVTAGMQVLGDASKEASKSDTWAVFTDVFRGSFKYIMGDVNGAKEEFMDIWDTMTGGGKDAVDELASVSADANRRMLDDEKNKHSAFSSLINAWKVQQVKANEDSSGGASDSTGLTAKGSRKPLREMTEADLAFNNVVPPLKSSSEMTTDDLGFGNVGNAYEKSPRDTSLADLSFSGDLNGSADNKTAKAVDKLVGWLEANGTGQMPSPVVY